MFQSDSVPDPKPKKRKKSNGRHWKRISISPVTLVLIFLVNLLVLVVLGWPLLQARFNLPIAAAPWGMVANTATPSESYTPGPPTDTPTPSNTPTSSNTPLPSSTPTASNTPTASATLPAVTVDPDAWEQGLIVLSLQEGLDSHLFVYQPVAQDFGFCFTVPAPDNWQLAGYRTLTQPGWGTVSLCFQPRLGSGIFICSILAVEKLIA